MRAQIYSEAKILYKCSHEIIIKCVEVFESSRHIYMVTEFCQGGDLQIFNSKRSKRGILAEKEVKRLAVKLAQGIQYLHNHDIVHRDIKPENILIDEKKGLGQPVITDFGFAKVIPNGKKCNSICGTKGYIAPEIYRGEPYGFPCDIWAFGVLLYGLVSDQLPFPYADI